MKTTKLTKDQANLVAACIRTGVAESGGELTDAQINQICTQAVGEMTAQELIDNGVIEDQYLTGSTSASVADDDN